MHENRNLLQDESSDVGEALLSDVGENTGVHFPDVPEVVFYGHEIHDETNVASVTEFVLEPIRVSRITI